MWSVVAFCVCMVALIGCATLPVGQPEREHILAMDSSGAVRNLADPDRPKPIMMARIEDELSCPEGTASGLCDVLRGLDRRYARDDQLDLLVVIHGGLNSPPKAIERATKQIRTMRDSGDFEKLYPLFVIWNSGGLSTYGDHLARIRLGTVWGWQGPASAPLIAGFDAIATVAGAPQSWTFQGLAPFYSSWVNSANPCMHVDPPTTDARVVTPVGGCTSWLARFSPNLLPTAAIKILTTPIADSLGHPAFDVMRRRADLLTRNSVSSDDFSQNPKAGRTAGGLEALALAIRRRLEGDAWDRSKVRITLIGHSMGAIVVNDVLLRFPDLPVTNVVHLASADTLRKLETAVEPYLRASQVRGPTKQANFYSLMLHPEREDLEVSSWNTVPQGSLLTWIDNLYSSPPTRLDRTSGRWDNVARWLPLVARDVAGQMSFRVLPYVQDDLPTHHGEFDDLRVPGSPHPEYWHREFWTGSCHR